MSDTELRPRLSNKCAKYVQKLIYAPKYDFYRVSLHKTHNHLVHFCGCHVYRILLISERMKSVQNRGTKSFTLPPPRKFDFSAQIFTKFLIIQQHCEDISHIELHSNQSRNMYSAGRNFFTFLSKVCIADPMCTKLTLSLHTYFVFIINK